LQNRSRAEQASAVFSDLSDWLHAKGPNARVTANDWQHEFVAAEVRFQWCESALLIAGVQCFKGLCAF
jgi:hypothetical protein